MSIDEGAIQAIAKAIADGNTLEQIHEAAKEKGWDEETFFLVYQAAKLLHQTVVAKEQEMKNRPLPFGRKS